MSVASRLGDEPVPLDLALRVEEIYSRFQSAWNAGRRPQIEDFLGELPEGPGRPGLLAELRAHSRVGNIRNRLRQTAEAETAYVRSRDPYQQLVANFPTVPEYRHELAKNHNDLGNLQAC